MKAYIVKDNLNFRAISANLGLHPTSISRSRIPNKQYPLIKDILASSAKFDAICEVHRLHKLGGKIPVSLRKIYIEYLRKMGENTIQESDLWGLYYCLCDDITLSQVVDSINEGYDVELWRYESEYKIRRMRGDFNGGQITGEIIVTGNPDVIYCGDIKLQNITNFKNQSNGK